MVSGMPNKTGKVLRRFANDVLPMIHKLNVDAIVFETNDFNQLAGCIFRINLELAVDFGHGGCAFP